MNCDDFPIENKENILPMGQNSVNRNTLKRRVSELQSKSVKTLRSSFKLAKIAILEQRFANSKLSSASGCHGIHQSKRYIESTQISPLSDLKARKNQSTLIHSASVRLRRNFVSRRIFRSAGSFRKASFGHQNYSYYYGASLTAQLDNVIHNWKTLQSQKSKKMDPSLRSKLELELKYRDGLIKLIRASGGCNRLQYLEASMELFVSNLRIRSYIKVNNKNLTPAKDQSHSSHQTKNHEVIMRKKKLEVRQLKASPANNKPDSLPRSCCCELTAAQNNHFILNSNKNNSDQNKISLVTDVRLREECPDTLKALPGIRRGETNSSTNSSSSVTDDSGVSSGIAPMPLSTELNHQDHHPQASEKADSITVAKDRTTAPNFMVDEQSNGIHVVVATIPEPDYDDYESDGQVEYEDARTEPLNPKADFVNVSRVLAECPMLHNQKNYYYYGMNYQKDGQTCIGGGRKIYLSNCSSPTHNCDNLHIQRADGINRTEICQTSELKLEQPPVEYYGQQKCLERVRAPTNRHTVFLGTQAFDKYVDPVPNATKLESNSHKPDRLSSQLKEVKNSSGHLSTNHTSFSTSSSLSSSVPSKTRKIALDSKILGRNSMFITSSPILNSDRLVGCLNIKPKAAQNEYKTLQLSELRIPLLWSEKEHFKAQKYANSNSNPFKYNFSALISGINLSKLSQDESSSYNFSCQQLLRATKEFPNFGPKCDTDLVNRTNKCSADENSWCVFALARYEHQIWHSKLITGIDASFTDITFDKASFAFKNVEPKFTITLQFYGADLKPSCPAKLFNDDHKQTILSPVLQVKTKNLNQKVFYKQYSNKLNKRFSPDLIKHMLHNKTRRVQIKNKQPDLSKQVYVQTQPKQSLKPSLSSGSFSSYIESNLRDDDSTKQFPQDGLSKHSLRKSLINYLFRPTAAFNPCIHNDVIEMPPETSSHMSNTNDFNISGKLKNSLDSSVAKKIPKEDSIPDAFVLLAECHLKAAQIHDSLQVGDLDVKTNEGMKILPILGHFSFRFDNLSTPSFHANA